jgi:hypothetical protein
VQTLGEKSPRAIDICRVLNQAAHAAVKKKGSHFQVAFRRLLPRLGYQSAIGPSPPCGLEDLA